MKSATQHHGQGTLTSWNSSDLTTTIQLTNPCRMRNDIPSILHLTFYIAGQNGYCEYYGIYNRWRGENWNEIVCNYTPNCKMVPYDYTNTSSNNVFEMTSITLKAESSEVISRFGAGSVVFVEIY